MTSPSAPYPILEITDGILTVDLLNPKSGIVLKDWTPAIAEPKGGGVWKDSPITEGRRLAYRKLGTVSESFMLGIVGTNQDTVIETSQNLRRLLEKAVAYWITDWTDSPVYIKTRAPKETNIRYALILDYRTPTDDNPFAQPFFSCTPAMDDFQLAIERGHWIDNPPRDPSCLEISAEYNWIPISASAEIILNPGFETAGGGHPDVFASWVEHTGLGDITRDFIHPYAGTYCCKIVAGIWVDNSDYVYQNFAVVAGSLQVITFYSCSDHPVLGSRYKVRDVTHGLDIIPITNTGITGWTYKKTTVSFTVPAGCVSVGIYLYGPDYYSLCGELWPPVPCGVYYDEVHANSSPYFTMGRSETCADEVYLTNHHKQANLTHIMFHPVGGAYDTDIMLDPLPQHLTTGALNGGAEIYFGIDTAIINYGTFSSLVFDLSYVCSNVAMYAAHWEYHIGGDPGTWPDLTVQDNTNDGGLMTGQPLNTLGVGSVHWIIPSDWTPVAMGGITAYWVRLNIDPYDDGSGPIQQNRLVYTISLPYIEVAADEIGGDIPAIIDVKMENESDGITTTAPRLESQAFCVGLRSVARGPTFTPFLNMSDRQYFWYPTDASVVGAGAHCTFHDNVQSPTGRCAYYNPGGVHVRQHVASFTLRYPYVDDYLGTFHLYMRAKQTGGTAGDIGADIQVWFPTYPLYYQSPIVYSYNIAYPDLYDFGVFNFSGLSKEADASRGVSLQQLLFWINLSNAGAGTLDIYELILMPTDEYYARFIFSDSGVPFMNSDDIWIRSNIYSINNISCITFKNYMTSKWICRAPGSMIMQSNANQRLWFLFDFVVNESMQETSARVRINKMQRYLGMRGKR